MIKSKTFVLALSLIILLPFMVGCASSGNRKPKVVADQSNDIPADIPSQFLDRYEHFATGKEEKEFKKLSTDEERQIFIDKFWLERDIDPSTLENEFKEKIDDRIDDIANEPFFSASGTTGLLFRSNGGFKGDMAQVYLLHGEPDAIDMLEGQSFVDLMLWVYSNPENGSILYAFLFYQKGGSGSFLLFPQDSYQMDQCVAIYEVAALRTYNYSLAGGGRQNCPEDLYRVYNEIWNASGKGGILDGQDFTWALFNFSSDSSLKQGKALQPPKPASEIAKQSEARITGEVPKLTGIAGTDYILASCDRCNSMIPGELKLGKEFALSVRRGDLDWKVTDNSVEEVELKMRIVLENTSTNFTTVFEKPITYKELKGLVTADVSYLISITLLTTDEVEKIPAGNYRVSVYIKNMMTKKYNAWSKEFTK